MTFFVNIFNYIVANSVDLSGFILPPIIDYINKDIKNETERFWVTILVCSAAAVVINWDKFSIGLANQTLSLAGLFFIESQVVFKFYFKYSYLRQHLKDRLTPEVESKEIVQDQKLTPEVKQ